MQGWVHVDGNPLVFPDMWLDLRNPLPFPTGSVDFIFSCHVLEHFYSHRVRQILTEWCRVLRKGGGARIVVPSLEKAVAAYQRSDFSTFHNMAGRSIGRRFVEWILYYGQHKCMFDFGYLAELLEDAGFSQVEQRSYLDSRYLSPQDLAKLEHTPDLSLFVEAQK